MKKSLLVLVAVLISVVAMAQAPQKMTYQAVVRDNNGQLVSNGNVGVRISIVRGSETGAEVYSQTETVRTNHNGLFTTMIGDTGFDAIDWSNGPYYLKSEVDPNGGNNYILTTTQQMVSVPYALHAGTVDNIIGGVNFTETDPIFTAWDKDYNDLINKPTIPTVPSNISELNNDAGYITDFIETQVLSISNDTIYLTGGSYVKLPVLFSGDYNDLTNLPTIPTSISDLTNDAGYLTSYTETQTLANVATLGNAVETQIKQLSDPTEELDAVNLRTLNLTISTVVSDWSHRFDSLAHRFDSIASSLDSIIAYQDSVIDTLSHQLAIMGTTVGDTTATECDSFIWYGTTYIVSGDYEHRLTNEAGFDSILTMHLTINYGTHNSESQTACDSHTWHGTPYTASGDYTYDYINGEGCASVDTLHLVINESTSATDTYTECNTYTWIDGNTYNASNTTATFTLTNAVGCDSLVTLNLTLNRSTHNTETQTAVGGYNWHETEYTVTGNYTYSYINDDGCESVDTLHLTISAFDTNGATYSTFTVNSLGEKVKFAKGNLQFKTTGTHSTSFNSSVIGTWRFAEHQYDYRGTLNSNTSSSYTGWIDLFGWATSGGHNIAYPWDTVKNNGQYTPGAYSNTPGPHYYNNLTGSYNHWDWGVMNSISNGGNLPGMWRTLTKSEWQYLLNTRESSTVGGTDNARYAKAIVCGKNGIIIFPDSFIQPTDIDIVNVNTPTAAYTDNTYSVDQWFYLESGGCVFLPAAGLRTGSSVSITAGYYWSSSSANTECCANALIFSGSNLDINGGSRYAGRSVRLVKDDN